jgi:Mg2+/citrate symporter
LRIKKIIALILLGAVITFLGILSVVLMIMEDSAVEAGLVGLGISVLFGILFIAVLYDKGNFSWKDLTRDEL